MTRLLITNAYSARNAGDAAILLGMVESLRRNPAFADAEIAVSSADHPADAVRYPFPVAPSFHSLRTAVPGGNGIRCLHFLLALLPLSVAWALAWRLAGVDLPLPRGLRELMRRYAAADLVVAAGGGYLYTTSIVHGNVMLLIHLHSFLLATLLGKPVYLYAQSVGPFAASFQARLVRAALARVRLVEVREEVSRRLVEGWRLPVPVHEAADAAFLLPADVGDAPSLPGPAAALRVGITVRRWLRDPVEQSRYQTEVAGFVDRLIDGHDAEVVFVPQVTCEAEHDDDRRVAREVASRVRRADRVRLIEEEMPAAAVKALCGSADLFVGTRMHSNIFALSQAVPVVAVSYQPKTEGIMAQAGLSDLVVPIREATADRLLALVERALARDGEIRGDLRRRLPELEASAALAGRLIAEDFQALDRPVRSARAAGP